MDVITLQQMLTGAIGGAVSSGLLKGPIDTVENYWKIFVGHYSEEKILKIRAKQEIDVNLYKEELAKNMSKIEPRNFKEPEMNILGPTLEASKYYIEDEKMRSMFSKLLAASMDKSKDDKVHNSFVEIIKQLSPEDAKNLVFLGSKQYLPIVQIKSSKTASNDQVVLEDNYFISESGHSKTTSMSMDNLKRLGLITINYGNQLTEPGRYKIYEDTILKIKSDQISKSNSTQTNPNLILGKPFIVKGIVGLTNFGKKFNSICID